MNLSKNMKREEEYSDFMPLMKKRNWWSRVLLVKGGSSSSRKDENTRVTGITFISELLLTTLKLHQWIETNVFIELLRN